MKKKFRCRFVCMLLLASLVTSPIMRVSATTVEELEQQKKELNKQKKQTQAGLNNAKNEISTLSESMGEIQDSLDEIDAELVALLSDITMIEQSIEETEVKIEETEVAYKEACEEEKTQYDAMKVRVRYLYEKGDDSYLTLFLESSSISDALTKADYVEKLYEYDRQMLEQYQAIVLETAELKAQLEEEKSELMVSKIELKDEQKYLSEIQAQKKLEYENYDAMLVKAKQEAAAYTAKINQQNSEIRAIEKEAAKKKAEEEARKKAEEEARKKAALEAELARKKAEEEQKKKQSLLTTIFGGNEDSGNQNNDDQSNQVQESYEEPKEEPKQEEGPVQEEEPKQEEKPAASSGNASLGQQIANYGCNFIGNPYVAGGTSLTNGADCSGFTMSVYQHFGISLPRTSYSQAGVGREVSYSEAQPGDLIYYGGHVAIYIGNGQIVHASTERTGIKITNALYRSIITVRRVV